MITIKLFGITREIVGSPILNIEEPISTVGELKEFILQAYPKIKALNSLLIAVNSEYAENEKVINSTDEIALIPPVSGG